MLKYSQYFYIFLFSRVDNPSGLAPRSGQERRISFEDNLPLPSQETFNEIRNEDDLHVDDLPNRKSNLKKVLCNRTQPKQINIYFFSQVRPKSDASNWSGYSEDQDDQSSFLETIAAFAVIRVLFFDILVSFGDAVTDFLQGFNLIFQFSKNTRDESILNSDGLPTGIYPTWKYGVATLVICWIPGIVGVIHVVTHYRSLFLCS